MAEEPSKYLPTTIEKVFELLDNKLLAERWTEAIWCFAGAAGVWLTTGPTTTISLLTYKTLSRGSFRQGVLWMCCVLFSRAETCEL